MARPQSTAPAAATGRATRATSQEVASTAPLPIARTSRRKVQTDDTAAESTTTTGQKGRKNNVAEDLDAIVEDTVDPVEEPEDAPAQPAPAVAETQAAVDAPAAESSEQVNPALDRDLMLEELGELYGHAEQVIALTAQMPEAAGGNFETVLNHWRQMGVKPNNLLRQRIKKFSLSKDVFTTNPDGMYLKKVDVCDAMLGVDHYATHRDVARRLEEVLHLANLAELAAALIASDGDDQAQALLLELFDPEHPDPFIASFLQTDPTASSTGDALAVGSSNLLKESFDIGLEARTQLAFVSLAEHVSEPGDVLSHIFMDEAAENSKFLFKGWNSVPLGGGEAPLHAKYQNTVKKRYNELVKAYTKDQSDADALEELKEAHPWDSFVAKVFSWISSRDIEIQESIRLRGGIEGIVQGVESAIKGPAAGTVAPVANMMGSRPATQGSKRRSLLASAMLRNAAGFLAEPQENVDTSAFLQSDSQLLDADSQTGTTPEGSPMSKIARDLNTIPADDQAADNNALQDLSAAALRLTQLRSQNELTRNAPEAAPMKSVFDARKRAFADAQTNAEIVNFDSQTPVKGKGKKAGNKRKKPAEDDVSEDDGFERDNRPVNADARRAANASTDDFAYSPSEELPTPAATKRQKTGSGRPGSLVRPTQPPPKPRAERPADAGTPPPPSQSYQTYKSTQQLAKSNTAQLIDKPRQSRVPWSESEEQALFEYIQQYGCQWSHIKKEDDGKDKLLGKRDQVALKDKARNMYFDFLKAGHTQLPHNFINVTLSTAQKNKLINLGLWGENGPTLVNQAASVSQVAEEAEADTEIAPAEAEAEVQAEVDVMAEPMEE